MANGDYNNCDRGGECSIDVYYKNRTGEKAYGYGSEYTINTERPFNVKTEFHETDNVFTSYTMTWT